MSFRLFFPVRRGFLFVRCMLLSGFLAVLSLCPAPARGEGSDCWLSVNGAGLNDGTSPENAYGAGDGGSAQKCWEQTAPGGTMHVLAGNYSRDDGTFWSLSITKKNSGPENGTAKKTLKASGDVRIEGSRPVPFRLDQKSRGGTWIHFKKGAHHVKVSGFHVSRVAEGILADEGENHDLEFEELHFSDTRQNFVLHGHPACLSEKKCPGTDLISRRIVIRRTSGLRYSKRHVRLSRGIEDVLVSDSHADSAFQDGDFAVGFDVEGPSRNIEFRDCSSSANFYSLSDYWNGDGFKSETGTRDIRWIRCSAFDNADAGFDIKTPAAELQDIVAMRNKRNLRVWSHETSRFKNVLSAASLDRGGVGPDAGLWAGGSLECRRCTIYGNTIQVLIEVGRKAGEMTFYDSILGTSGKNQRLFLLEEGARVNLLGSYVWQNDKGFRSLRDSAGSLHDRSAAAGFPLGGLDSSAGNHGRAFPFLSAARPAGDSLEPPSPEQE